MPGKVVSVSCDELEFGARAAPAVLFTFDDGWSDQYSRFYPVLRSYGMRGSVFVWTGKVGTRDFVTVDQLRELDSVGWSICNHTRDHVGLAGLSETAQVEQLEGARDDLHRWGLSRCSHYVAYPFGTCDTNTLVAMASTGMLLGRNGDMTISDAYCLSPSTLYQIRSNGVSSSYGLAAVEGWVDRTIAEGSVLPLHFHKASGPGQWDLDTFTQLVDYVYSRRDRIAVLTMDDLYRCTLGPIQVPRPAK
jgi:peptidoglycan/xylan/chitin deacetylase (PgdA/CDA1 family)